MFCCTLLYVHFSIAIILMGKRELIALLNLSSWCLVMVERLFLTVPRGCLQFVIVVFPDHTHLLFFIMLNVDFRVKQLRLSHVHKIFNGYGPSFLSEQFIKVSDVHNNYTRGSTEHLIVPSVNGVAATIFYYSGIKDWNSLPSDVKQKCTFNGFKSAARQYLRSQMQLMESDTYVYY